MDHPCPECAAPVFYRSGRGGQPVFCSACRPDRTVKYEVSKTTGSYDRKLAARRARYLSRSSRTVRFCEVDGCDRKHLARGMCKKHWSKDRRDRGMDGSPTKVIELQSIAWLHSAFAAKVKKVRCRLTIGVVVECPWCSSIMAATNPTFRLCGSCGTSLELNAEEVSWLTSEARSIQLSRQAG